MFFVENAILASFLNFKILLMFRKGIILFYPPASKASREVANVTERKNPPTPVYGVKEFVCLSVNKFDPNYLRTG